MALDIASDNKMVYPQMFPGMGDGPQEEKGQDEQQQQQSHQNQGRNFGDAEALLQQRAELLRQLQQQQQQQSQFLQQQQHQQALQASAAAGAPSGPGMGHQGMLAGISPAVLDAHQRRTQSILSAAIAAANQAGDARNSLQSPLGAAGMGAPGMAGMSAMAGMGGAAGGMGAGAAGLGPPGALAGMGGTAGLGVGMGAGMGFPTGAGMGFPPASAGLAGYGSASLPGGQLGQQEAAASSLYNRYSSLGSAAASIPQGSFPESPRRKEPRQKKTVASAAKKTKTWKKRSKTFPEKLMQAMTEHPNDDAVAWLPDGKSFVVVDPDEFVETVLKQVFKECKYSSFVRKLHRWGFVRLTSGTGTDCFHHPLFQKGRNDLCLMITCTPRDTTKAPDKSNPAVAAAMQEKPPSLAGVEKFIMTRKKKKTPK